MKPNLLGMEIVGTANALRRMTFHTGYDERFAEDSPTNMQQWFLAYIWEQGPVQNVYQKDIEERFQVRRSTATEILKAMERKALIVRIPIPEDKRKKKILLTEKALAICQENQAKIERTEQQIIRGLSNDEIVSFLRVLKKIQNNITD